MLLRYFVNFYDMEIIEEEAFLAWKEDVNQEYPGKGKALFQVILCPFGLVLFFFHTVFQFSWQVWVLLVYMYTIINDFD